MALPLYKPISTSNILTNYDNCFKLIHTISSVISIKHAQSQDKDSIQAGKQQGRRSFKCAVMWNISPQPATSEVLAMLMQINMRDAAHANTLMLDKAFILHTNEGLLLEQSRIQIGMKHVVVTKNTIYIL